MIASRKALIIVAAFVLIALGLPWGGAVPAAFAQTISVTAADPPTGEQGTLSLSVTIKGKGFKTGANAAFFKTGTTDPAGVNVKSTKYVSATQIVATIDITDTAVVAQFDIQVRNTDGRTGKGTELFSVLAKKIDLCTAPDSVPSPSWYAIASDTVPGALDSTFGGNGTGKAVGPRYLDVGYLEGRPIAIQPDGKIVAVGIKRDTCGSTAGGWGIARYLSDGNLDSSFGSGGLAIVSFVGGASEAEAVALQPVDGKIVVVGSAKPGKKGTDHYQSVVVRLNSNGSLDSTFGSSGMAWVSPTSGGGLNSVALQADGKIVAAGISGATGSTGLVSRLTQNGALDTTFNKSGTYFSPTSADFRAVTTQTVGGHEFIVVAGAIPNPISAGAFYGAVWRFDPSGHLDPSFGGSGMVTTPFHDIEDGRSFDDHLMDVAIDSSGRIVAAGYAWVNNQTTPYNTQSQVVLARYLPDGTLDPAFGSGGRVWASSTEVVNVGLGLVIQPADQKIVVAGYAMNNDAAGNSGTDEMGGVWRFNANGTVDTGFGPGGWGWVLDAIVSGSSHAAWYGIALQQDGKVVCGGDVIMRAGTSMVTYAAIARFWQ